jgi:hypothetical protein
MVVTVPGVRKSFGWVRAEPIPTSYPRESSMGLRAAVPLFADAFSPRPCSQANCRL